MENRKTIRPDLHASLVDVVTANDVHLCVCELDHALLLQLLYGLHDTYNT